MLDAALTTSSDLDVSTGDLRLIDGPPEVKQNLVTRLNFNQGEWFLDQTIGIPYFTQVFVARANLAAAKQVLSQAISTTPGILSLLSLVLSLDAKRNLSVQFKAQEVSGAFVEGVETLVFGGQAG